VANATTQGLEFKFRRRIDERWEDRLGFSRLSTWTDGDPLLRRPKYAASYAILYNGRRGTFNLLATYVGRRFDAKTWPGPDIVGSYFVVDVAASRKVNDTTTLWLRINNLLDKQYEAAANYPSPGINFLAGISRQL